ncbi:MAG TPA: hypothetical protein DFS52_07895 [Myxococcales bacterium]|jgi:Flp pilus assembly secretin CpaC|nr:hypothetical protein [Myxococcales bacterium]
MRALCLRTFLFFAAAILGACGVPSVAGETPNVPPEDEPILLALGEQRTLTFPGMSHAAVGDPSVVDLEELLDSEQVRLTGADEGSTTMLVWKKDGSDRLAYLLKVTAANPGDGAK